MLENEVEINHGIGGDAWLLATSYALERGAYYGLRGMLFIHLLNNLYFEEQTNVDFMTMFGGAIVIMKVIGALIGDLLSRNKAVAQLGLLLYIIGTTVFFFPGDVAFYCGIILVIIGSAFYSPNIKAQYGSLFLFRKEKLSSAFGLFNIMINLGAFIGVISIIFLGDDILEYGLLATMLFLILSFIMLSLANKQNENEAETESKIDLSTKRILVGAGIIIFVLLPVIYEFGRVGFNEKTIRIREHISIVNGYTFNSVIDMSEFIAILIIGILLSFYWWNNKGSLKTKLIIGIVLSMVSFIMILPLSENGQIDLGAFILLLSAAVLAIGNFFNFAALMALITKYCNPKYLATAFGLSTLFTYLLTYLLGVYLDLYGRNGYANLALIISVLILAGVIPVIIWLFRLGRRQDSTELDSNIGDDI